MTKLEFRQQQTKLLFGNLFSNTPLNMKNAIRCYVAFNKSPFIDITKEDYRKSSIKMRRWALRKMRKPNLPL